MAPLFVESGYDVVGLDTDFFADCCLIPPVADIPSVHKDIRDLEPRDLVGFDAVVHLAALSNDPIGNLNDSWTNEINAQASVRLAHLARAAGVQRFLFSSSCIMYGMSEVAEVDEMSPLEPQTTYAASKVKAEDSIRRLARDGFSPTFLRNGTVYGISPRMRFDTVFNDLIGSAVTTGEVVLNGDGSPWRPVVHVRDVARAFLAVLEAPIAAVHNEAFNTGARELNHQVSDLARIAVETCPGSTLRTLGQPSADRRTYKADFTKFAKTFPGFRFEWDAQSGARELFDAFRATDLTTEAFLDARFTRLRWLRHLLDSGRLDSELRWAVAEVQS
jgi:nucleoside-diphosphate-sugar epimerase